MMYVLTFSCLSEQLIHVKIVSRSRQSHPQWQLPYWRPGRYEQQRYDMNVRDIVAKDAKGNALPVVKKGARNWEVNVDADREYILTYSFFANQLDAGGSYIDHEMIYINGINLLMYEKGNEHSECRLSVELPSGFSYPHNFPNIDNGAISFEDYHSLVDMPFIVSKTQQLYQFQVNELTVNLSIHGGKIEKLESFSQSLASFIEAQMNIFGSIPIESYTFWILLLPYRFRHGVEHLNSTVVVMGPWYKLQEASNQDSLLEICSHEFFHIWNVKAFRPRELTPYDYSRPVYSHLHYITEGITTYYGYVMLWRSGVWSFQNWIKYVNEELSSFYSSGGKDNISLEAASINSWVNGYSKKGVPNHRISFYTKGHLVALMLDFVIRDIHDHELSLDDIMRSLYEFCESGERGYSKEDFFNIIEDLTQIEINSFYTSYIAGTQDLREILIKFGDFLGLKVLQTPFETFSESLLGLQVYTKGNENYVKNFFPGSKALETGLVRGDQLVALDGHQIGADWDDMVNAYRGRSGLTLHFFHQGKLNKAQLNIPRSFTYMIPQLAIISEPDIIQSNNRRLWRRMAEHI